MELFLQRRLAVAVFRARCCCAPPKLWFLARPICRRQSSTTSSVRVIKQSPPQPKITRIQPALTRRPTRPSPIPDSDSSPKPNPLKHRTIPILLGGLTVFLFSTYCTYVYIKVRRAVSDPALPSLADSQFDVSERYNDIAQTFDSSVDWTESIIGLTRMRRQLAQQAKGDVLEVAVGTGRNLEFYKWNFMGLDGGKGKDKKGKVRSFTVVDKSPEMLEIAHEKFAKLFPGILGVRWIIADAGEKGKIPGPPRDANERSGNIEGGKYDTVVETMGLCSVSDPVAYLRNLGELVKEDEGRILLLEHGRGKWELLNKLLDKYAESHAMEFGCWWNRDLGSIVQESGLEVVEVRRPWSHGGTTWWIELRRPKSRETDDSKAEKKIPAEDGQ